MPTMHRSSLSHHWVLHLTMPETDTGVRLVLLQGAIGTQPGAPETRLIEEPTNPLAARAVALIPCRTAVTEVVVPVLAPVGARVFMPHDHPRGRKQVIAMRKRANCKRDLLAGEYSSGSLGTSRTNLRGANKKWPEMNRARCGRFRRSQSAMGLGQNQGIPYGVNPMNRMPIGR
jgi:hypothetical protein